MTILEFAKMRKMFGNGSGGGGGENRLNQFFANTITRITEEDLAGATEIEQYACCNHTNIVRVDIPDSIERIGNSAFSNCTNLDRVTVGNGVKSMNSGAFYQCNNLTRVDIKDIQCWCNISFGGWQTNPLSYAKNLYLNDELVTDVVIPSGLSRMWGYVFYNCTSLKTVTIAGISALGSNDFGGCTNLERVIIKNTIPPTIKANTFEGVPTTCIYEVPAASVDAYKSATNWSALNIVASEDF